MIKIDQYKQSSHRKNRMKQEGDVAKARDYFFSNAPLNLKYLLEKRFGWMNNFLKNEDSGIEVGCGTGLSKLFIKCRNYLITDYADNEWLDDKMVDALNTPYENESLNFVISSNMIHHVPYPIKFFKEMHRILKPGGVVIIQEINCSWAMRRILKLMRHEGYDYTINVFDENLICTDPNDLWSANCAIPNLLFDNQEAFRKHIPYFSIEKISYSELFLFLNSGGVIAKTKCIRLPKFLLRLVNRVDKILVAISPSTFALQRQIVLRK